MMITSIPKSFSNFEAKLGHLKVKKPSKKDLSASFWTHRKQPWKIPLLRGENGLQMHKLKMFQILDRNTFPMSYLGLNLAKGKVSKIS